MSEKSRSLEYAKVLVSEDKIRVEIRDGAKIVRRSPDYFATQQLADDWIVEQTATCRTGEQQEAGKK